MRCTKMHNLSQTSNMILLKCWNHGNKTEFQSLWCLTVTRRVSLVQQETVNSSGAPEFTSGLY